MRWCLLTPLSLCPSYSLHLKGFFFFFWYPLHSGATSKFASFCAHLSSSQRLSRETELATFARPIRQGLKGKGLRHPRLPVPGPGPSEVLAALR